MLLPRRRPPAGILHHRWRYEQARAFVDARVKWVRDRGLDHAVEKEKHLLAFNNLKDLLLLDHDASGGGGGGGKGATPSLPLSLISSRRDELRLPFRAIRFIRLFPSAFIESATTDNAPLISPTPALIRLHAEETLAVKSSLPDAADRLLRLLMLTPRRRIPLRVLDRLRWDLGLPRDYPRTLLPDYPDYFHLTPSPTHPDLDLELVCYNKDLAVSAMESYARRTGYKKGMPLSFPLQYPRGFQLEKKIKKWVDDWQKLPYVSPYEDGSQLPPKSDIQEKWTVGVLHELLHLLIGKKTEKENLILLCEHVGLRPGFRKVITHHPGIFYVSNKLRTQTVVLREAYHRQLLLEKHPLMGLRYQYIHLMHKGKETGKGKKDKKSKRATREQDEEEDGDDNNDDDDEDDEDEEDEDEDYEDDEDDEDDDDDDDDDDDEDITETEDEESDDDDLVTHAAGENALPQPLVTSQPIQRRSPSLTTPSIERHLRTSKTNIGKKLNGRASHPHVGQRSSLKRKTSISNRS